MALQVHIDTNIDDHLNNVDDCKEAIAALKDMISTIRIDMYGHYLGLKTLLLPVIISLILLTLFIISENNVFLYVMPLPVVFTMLLSITLAERVSSLIRKELNHKIESITRRMKLLEEEA